MYVYIILPVCTAQGGGGIFKVANYRRLVAVNHGLQSKSTDGSKGGWRQQWSCSCSCTCSCGVMVVRVVVVAQ